MTTPTAYISRPRVLLGGQVNENLSADVLSSRVEETTAGLFRCEVRLNNYGLHDYLYFKRDILDFGKDFALRMGRSGQDRQVFKGRISGLEAVYPPGGGAQMSVLAEDR